MTLRLFWKKWKRVFIASYRANKKGTMKVYFEAKEMLSRGKTDILGLSAINQEVIKLDISTGAIYHI